MKRQKTVKKKLKIGRFEKLLYTFTILLVIGSPFGIVFSQATLSKINFDVEKAKKEVAYQEKKNESLNMKISEMASLDKIEEVAEKQGLSYNNDNIKSIEK